MATAIELLNPNRQWNIGSKGQLNQLDVNGNLSVANDLSVNNNLNINGNIKLTNTNTNIANVYGPETIIIDPHLHDNISGKVIINGDLEVKGIETIINSQTVEVSDNIIRLNANYHSLGEGGIEVLDSNDNLKKFTWKNDLQEWSLNGEKLRASEFIGDLSGSATLFDGSGSSYYLNYDNLYNKPDVSDRNIVTKNTLDSSNNLTISTNIQDLSGIFYNSISPSKNISKIMINLKLTYFCSVAYKERINIELWRENTLLSKDINVGCINATGGFTNSYSINMIDVPGSIDPQKYYIKYQLENNNSGIEQGIVNINTELINSNVNGSSCLTLYEL